MQKMLSGSGIGPGRLGVRTESRGEEISNPVAADSQRRNWDMRIKENPHEGALGS